MTLGCADDQQLSPNVQRTDPIEERVGVDGTGRTAVPVGKTLVPGSSQQGVMLVDERTLLDASFVLGHLMHLIRCQVPELDLSATKLRVSLDGGCRSHLSIRSAKEDASAILTEGAAEDGFVVGLHRFWRALD